MGKKKTAPDKKEKRSRLPSVFDLPPDTMGDLPSITLIGRELLKIEGHRGIYTYAPERLRLGTACGILTVYGQGLCIEDMAPGSIVITGNVQAVEYPGKTGGDIR